MIELPAINIPQLITRDFEFIFAIDFLRKMLTQTLTTHTLKEFFNSVKPKIKVGSRSICSFAMALPSFNEKILHTKLQDFHTSFFIHRKAINVSCFAFNPILEININGADRFRQIEQTLKNYTENVFLSPDHFNENLPLFFGGMKFSSEDKNEYWNNYDDANWFIPQIAFVSIGKKYFFIFNFIVDGDAHENNIIAEFERLYDSFFSKNRKEKFHSDEELKIVIGKNNSATEWKKKVDAIRDSIGKGEYEKVVLARSIEGEVKSFNISTLISKLEEKNTSADIFIYKRGDSFFFGATPEKMLSINGRNGQTESLAGSIKRGANDDEDKIFEHELLGSSKDIAEQKIVTNNLINELQNLCEKIHYSDSPLVKKMPRVQHLWSLIEFTLKENISMFSVLEKIFPTPATCGYPVHKAEEVIKNLESMQRGLYAGLIGYFNLNNFGEFLVAIRSALINKNKFYAFAGSGIVAGSNSENEFIETELKFSSILSVINNENK